MDTFFGIPSSLLLSQLLLGLINGSFYAMLSIGLALIFGMLHVINFVHGAFYMLGAFVTWALLSYLGVGYWWALIIAPVVVGLFAVILERLLLRRLKDLDPLYGLLLTFGISLIIEGIFQHFYGSSGRRYAAPEELRSSLDLGFMVLPSYRGFIVVASLALCLATWLVVERTRLGSYLRAATENASLVKAMGINVPLIVTGTYALGAALAAITGVLAAPIYQFSPLMGQNLMIVAFAIVVIGGMGSIGGAIVAGYALGIIEGLAKIVYAPSANTMVFILMAAVLLIEPKRFFRRTK
ncbi:MAG: branched-chain amino acid ABC transporter permease [Pseudorhizobium sp.]